MASSELPARPSLEYLKKLAKERLKTLRAADPEVKLSDAQLSVAREHGFPSWRALRAEVDRRTASSLEAFFAACAAGDVEAIGDLLDREPDLVRVRDERGATALHRALPHPEAVRLLLQRGADPNSREEGDNALPLHFAAGGASLETVRALLDAGSDVQGEGDAHRLDTIGWAACFDEARREVIDLLVERGARHHAFTAVALGDVELLRRVVFEDPRALERRLSPTEQEQSALHYVVAPPDGLVGGRFRTGEHYATLAALIELGADLEARDAKGRTPLDLAMLRSDTRAMKLLRAAGAKLPVRGERVGPIGRELARSVAEATAMMAVPDVNATVEWYEAVGFVLDGAHGEEGVLDFASVRLGEASIMFVPAGPRWRADWGGVSLWFRTDRLDDLYAHLKARQIERARAELEGTPSDAPELSFCADLYTAFYGQREFGLRDPNGLELMFFQPLE